MYIGIDLGTSGLKAILMSSQGDIIHCVNHGLEVSRPNPLWSEQNPQDWWQALQNCMCQLGSFIDLEQVQAIGLSGQMHGATLLDSRGKVIRPAILWNDGRSARQCEQIEKEVPDARFVTGNIVMPGFTAPKVLWIKQHEPDNFTRIHKVLLPKDYLRYCMTDCFASDMSDSAGTAWLDVGKRDWNTRLLQSCGLNTTHMPELFEGSQVTGHLTAQVAQDWGMKQVPVVAGAGDNAAGAIGVGVVESGQAMLSLGTSGVYFAVSGKFHSDADSALHSFCHALPEKWHIMAVILSAASCLQWFADSIAKAPLVELLQEMENANIEVSQAPLFLPYLSGERTPHNDPNARGMFFGLTHETNRAVLMHAVLEGVSFAFKDGADILHGVSGIPHEVTLIGGGSKSAYWRQMLADILNLPLQYRKGGEVGPALGAARLALISQHPEASIAELCPIPQLRKAHVPNSDRNHTFNLRYLRWRELYSRLIDLF